MARSVPIAMQAGAVKFDLIAQRHASRAGAKYLKFQILRISKSEVARGFKILKIPRSARRFDKLGLCFEHLMLRKFYGISAPVEAGLNFKSREQIGASFCDVNFGAATEA